MNKLKHLAEFQKILAHYRVSEASKRILDQTQLVVMAAATSSGRNTIIRELKKTGEYHFIVSDTTRNPRLNDGVLERDGVTYWFRSEEEVLRDLEEGEFLEASIIHNQQVSGVSIRELERAKDEGKIAISDIEIVGVNNIIKAKPNMLAIFLLPPNFEEWQRRIVGRGSLPKDEVRRRLESAHKEFAAALKHDYYKFIVNDKLSEAVERVHQLARFGQYMPEEQARGRQLAEKLFMETQVFLKSIET